MTQPSTPRRLLTLVLATAAAYGCTSPPAVTADEQTLTGVASAARPSRAPATQAPTPTPTATPRPAPVGTAVPTTGAPTFERGRVLATFETRGLDRSQAREVVCYPTDTGDAFVKARFVLADAASTEATALPERFSLELDMAMLEPATAYTLAYRPAGPGNLAIETKSFTIPTSAVAPLAEIAGGYTADAITFDEGGLKVSGTFSAVPTWRHAMVFDNRQRLVVSAHALVPPAVDSFSIAPVPGIPSGDEVTVYLFADGRIAHKKTIKRAAPIGQ